MSIRKGFRDWARPTYYLGQNPLSLTGAVLTTSTALTLIAFWFYDVFLPGPPHPYIGILVYLILPMIFLIGLVLIPIGIWKRRRGLRKSGKLPEDYPEVNLREPAVRRGFWLVTVATLANIGILGTASYRGVSYMDSTRFCGETCHTPMQPEYTAFKGSAHERVGCVGCHVGPGAEGFLRAKWNGVHQVIGVTFHTYPRPIPSPVSRLRPASETCENCHWPQQLIKDKIFVSTTFQPDEKNTPQTTVLLVKIGGPAFQGAAGIHGHHLQENSHVRYIAIDAQRQVIPVVDYTDASGKTTEFVSSDVKATKQQLDAGEHREMDCVDCHNRPGHDFQIPERAVDQAMVQGRIHAELPFMKKKAIELLNAEYADRETGAQRIIAAVNDFYRTSYAPIYESQRAAIQQSGEQVASIYLRNIFPMMRVTWGTHPNNLGHTDFPGCFRCHDGNHTSADGQTISADCGTCHNVLAMTETNPKILTDLGIK